MAYAVIHHFAGGARANYEGSIDTPILTGLGLAGINAEARRPAAQQRARRYGDPGPESQSPAQLGCLAEPCLALDIEPAEPPAPCPRERRL